MARKAGIPKINRPDVFSYHDYRDLLKDWLAWLKASQSGFSMRALSSKAGVALGYLPMVIARKRNLSPRAMAKLLPPLGLNPNEQAFFELLIRLGDADHQAERLTALERMKKFPEYRKNHARETEVLQYLAHWYYIAIREMTALPDFKLDPAWIQSRLKSKVSTQEIEKAVRFLTEKKYIEIHPDGKISPPDKTLDCLGGVFRVALTQMHHEMLSLAKESIENTPSAERAILGHSFALAEGDFEKARDIIQEAFEKVRELGHGKKAGKSVYHMELALFPLTEDENKGVTHE